LKAINSPKSLEYDAHDVYYPFDEHDGYKIDLHLEIFRSSADEGDTTYRPSLDPIKWDRVNPQERLHRYISAKQQR